MVEIAEDGTLASLERFLAGDFHVVYLSMHGNLDHHKNRGCLFFEAADSYRSEQVNDDWLEAVFFQVGVRRTPFLFHSGCRSAGAGTGPALSGVAQRLCRAGIPMVLGMRHPVADIRATAMAVGFLTALGPDGRYRGGSGSHFAFRCSRMCLVPDMAARERLVMEP